MDKWPKRHFPSFWFTENWNTSPDLSEKKNVKTLISRKKVVRAKLCNFHTVHWFDEIFTQCEKVRVFALTWNFFVKSTCRMFYHWKKKRFHGIFTEKVRVQFHNIYFVYLTVWKCKTFSTTQILREILIPAILCSLGLGFIWCKLISRKNWVTENFSKFHTVENGEQGGPSSGSL